MDHQALITRYMFGVNRPSDNAVISGVLHGNTPGGWMPCSAIEAHFALLDGDNDWLLREIEISHH